MSDDATENGQLVREMSFCKSMGPLHLKTSIVDDSIIHLTLLFG